MSPDGQRVVFLRSRAGDDPVNHLWVLDVASGKERLVVDADQEGPLSAEEAARRERARERGGGIVAYSTDRPVEHAVFIQGESIVIADLRPDGRVQRFEAPSAFDPRLDPTASRVAFVRDGALHVQDLEDGGERVLAEEDDPAVSWGVAEFIAAEEMGRLRGFWWAPDGSAVAAARVDESGVTELWIQDAVDPTSPPRSARFPLAGTRNADVSLWILGLDGSRTEVRWDRERFEYLARIMWPEDGALTLLVQSRDQRTTQLLQAEADGTTTLLREEQEEPWIELIDGSPDLLSDGRVVSTVDRDDTRRLAVDGEQVTPPGLQVRRILDVGDAVLFAATEEATEDHVWRWSPEDLECLTIESGVHSATGSGDVLVVTSETIERAPVVNVLVKGEQVHEIASYAEDPVLEPVPILFSAGARELRSALLLPGGREPSQPVPVLLDPYGGPHYQRVIKARRQYLESQWFADQGFAVLVIDGRGTPGRGLEWERAVYLDLMGTALQDQVDGLQAAAERFPFLDLSRVAMRGWSFGGSLAAMAVIRHPEIFAAAVAGAPATDERLYDTHYTERYLGLPDEHPEVYERSSPITDAGTLERPILIVHGMSDDNVFVANSLRLSRALLEAGKPHTFLPISGATHMAKEPEVAEHLLLLELRFLREALGLGSG